MGALQRYGAAQFEPATAYLNGPQHLKEQEDKDTDEIDEELKDLEERAKLARAKEE